MLFETGYGPSGLPHIGTFGEVSRTTMVRHAFRVLTEDRIPTRLVAFSDDMDGLRKVPDNIANKDVLIPHLGKPLTQVPDPFGTHPSFGEHNNARLRAFLDHLRLRVRVHVLDAGLQVRPLRRYADADAGALRRGHGGDAAIPSEERAQSYSPFLPIHPVTGVVMQVPLDEIDREKGMVVWRDPASGERYETPVTGGHCKLQWKPDWAMRWVALGVDYEMAGKDLIDSVKLSGEICRALGAQPPEGFNYELFLDEKGQKISKSKGNGLTIEEWLAYGSPDSLSYFMFQKPREAKRLHFDVIPRAADDYLTFLEKYPQQALKEQLGNPVWHVHGGNPPEPEFVRRADGNGPATTISFAMLLNLVAVANSEDPQVLWGFIRRYAPGVSPQNHPRLDQLVGYAVAYFRDFVRPAKIYQAPDDVARAALEDLSAALQPFEGSTDADALQAIVYEVGRRHFPRPAASPRARTAGPACRSSGSRRSTACCWDRSAGRASAPSPRSTAWPRRAS